MARSYLCPVSINIYKLVCIPCDLCLRHSYENSPPFIKERNRRTSLHALMLHGCRGDREMSDRCQGRTVQGLRQPKQERERRLWTHYTCLLCLLWRKTTSCVASAQTCIFLQISRLVVHLKTKLLEGPISPWHAESPCHPAVYLSVFPHMWPLRCFLQHLDVHLSHWIRAHPQCLIT